MSLRRSASSEACRKKSRQAHTAHGLRRGQNIHKESPTATCSSPAHRTTLLLTIVGKAPELKKPLQELPVAVPGATPSTIEPLLEWQLQFGKRTFTRLKPYEPTTEVGRLACAAASGGASVESERLHHQLPNADRVARPQSAPAGRMSLSPPSTPMPAPSESSVFVGSVPKVIRIDYEKLRRRFEKDKFKPLAETSRCFANNSAKVPDTVPSNAIVRQQKRLATNVEPRLSAHPSFKELLDQHAATNHGLVADDKQPLHRREEESSHNRLRPQSASACCASLHVPVDEEGARVARSKRRPKSALAAWTSRQHEGQLAKGSGIIDPGYIWEIIGTQCDLRAGRYEKKRMSASAKTNALY